MGISLNEINAVATKMISEGLVDVVYKSSPILDYLKRAELYYVYERAKDYGYKCEWAREYKW